MGRAGLATSAGLAGVRKYAVVGILTLAAIVTPPDVITQIILFTVVYGLYEVSIQLVRRFERQREAELREQGLWFEDDAPQAADVPLEDDPILKEFEDEEEADDMAHHPWSDDADDPGMVNDPGETGKDK